MTSAEILWRTCLRQTAIPNIQMHLHCFLPLNRAQTDGGCTNASFHLCFLVLSSAPLNSAKEELECLTSTNFFLVKLLAASYCSPFNTSVYHVLPFSTSCVLPLNTSVYRLRFNNYGEVYDAFFMPVTSEEHLLWTTGNARTELYFAEGANSSLLERYALNVYRLS